VSLHDAVWVLPATPQTTEHFRWIVAEIEELEGEATLWEGRLAMDGQEEALVKQFEQQVIPAYKEILEGIRSRKPDLAALSRAYQQVLAKDYFHSQIGAKVREALIAARQGKQGAKK
jgi:hypothetical protein